MRILLVLLLMMIPCTVSASPQLEYQIYKVYQKQKVKNPKYYAKLIANSKHSERDKLIAAAILIPESRGDAKAVSSEGAQGAWQVMPWWKKRLKISGSLFHPPTNLDVAMKVWNIHLREAKGDVRRALTLYSGGSTKYPEKIVRIMYEITMQRL